MAKIRLDKYLADMGIGTRNEVKGYLRKSMVCVNDTIVKKPESKVDPEIDRVTYQGLPVAYAAYEYYMLNKPMGVVSAVRDNRDRTVVDLIETRKRKDLFPVGRLDKDTEGLLLITNDGTLANQLLAPKKHVEKTYYAKVDGCVTDKEIKKFAEGVDIGEEKRTLPAKLKILVQGEPSEIELTITEGKFHQVKRMFQAVGMEVIFLKRLSMGTLILDDSLAPGEYRELTKEELNDLR